MKKIQVLALLFAASLASTACTDFLEEKPLDFVTPDQVTDVNFIANGALNTLASGSMFRYGPFPNLWDYDSDDATGPSWAFGDVGAGNYQSYWGIDYGWNGPYTLIHRCNFGISRVNAIATEDEAVKKNALGQLYFLRGWAYFMLVRGYGAVPLFEKAVTEGAEPQQPRTPVKDVYAFIIDNLKLAEANLKSTKDAGYEPGRPSKGAASSLLAKVYLTMASGALPGGQVTVMGGKAFQLVDGEKVLLNPQPITHNKAVVAGLEGLNAAEYFKLARDKAQEVMNSGEYYLFPSHAEVWTVGNRNRGEHIWSVQSLSENPDFGNEISLFRRGRLDPTKADQLEGGWIGTSYQWYHNFEEKDQRITDGVLHRWKMWSNTQFHYYPLSDSSVVEGVDSSPAAEAKRTKYGYQPTDVSGLDDGRIARLRKFEAVSKNNITLGDFHFPLLRYPDVLLIFAEADNEVNSGPTAAARDAVNQIRRRNSATEVGSLNQQQFRSFVLEERRRELALEGDRRWDLLRWGIYLPVMNAIDIDENNVIKRRQPKHLLYPIPISEVNSNKLIGGNNPGW
ncbi:RagB/SusD family nutrient uptake outer membrane protein (plasmid) [Hymenobacter sp. NBH84]|uniref:RagB/SusD family nutrient uptake outer membrane protein n=1 Tax=Hymenobacter sp. NBH84 TaxID=2596915 RepID=UPI001626CE80|nr:RagB/SusD family nutrient uptake outer membrane protein [Hymenobacter sp. NBH84]QNE42317.1 RagB/SusD family nutrient uptake outer membrane protein [Hymenobacter sp. NBH84]